MKYFGDIIQIENKFIFKIKIDFYFVMFKDTY